MSRIASIPLPIGGMNDRDPIDSMPLTDAITMTGWFPAATSLKLIGDLKTHSDTETSEDVETLFEHNNAAGDSRLVCATNNLLYDVTTALPADITGTTTPTVDQWHHIMMNNYSLLFNGTDQPQKLSYAASTWTVADAVYTGTDPASAALDDANLIQATSYRDRLYLIEKNKPWFWYGGSQAITGELTAYDLSYVLRLGGSLQFAATYSLDDGGGADDRLVLVSSQGEVLIYTGSYPGGSDWAKVGQYFLAKPVGRKAFAQIDNELVILTETGIIPISQVIAGKGEGFTPLTDKIQNTFRSSIASWGSTWGWSMTVWPQGPWLVVHIPGGTTYNYIMNLQTGAWCISKLGNATKAVSTFGKRLMLGDFKGTIFAAEEGGEDSGVSKDAFIVCAQNGLGQPGTNKAITMIRPVIRASEAIIPQNIGTAPFKPFVDIHMDSRSRSGSVPTVRGTGESSTLTTYDDWYGVDGLGRKVSVVIKSYSYAISMEIVAIDVLYESGGIL